MYQLCPISFGSVAAKEILVAKQKKNAGDLRNCPCSGLGCICVICVMIRGFVACITMILLSARVKHHNLRPMRGLINSLFICLVLSESSISIASILLPDSSLFFTWLFESAPSAPSSRPCTPYFVLPAASFAAGAWRLVRSFLFVLVQPRTL